MMQKRILDSLQQLKKQYQSLGFIIIGVFGSQARGDNSQDSDIDILYDIDKKFLENFSGWNAITKIEAIKQEIESTLGLAVDLASKDNSSKTFQNSLKDELLYV